MLIDQIIPPTLKLMEIHSRDARHVLAARSWCILRKAGQDPLPRLNEYLLCDTAAKRFGLLMETVTQVWPEPFAIHRPCCPTASLDESVLLRAIQYAAGNARPQFEELLREMLPEDARNMVFIRARFLYPAGRLPLL